MVYQAISGDTWRWYRDGSDTLQPLTADHCVLGCNIFFTIICRLNEMFNFFIGPKSNHCLALSVCQKVTDYLLLRLGGLDPGVWRCAYRRWVFHGEVVDVVDARPKQKPCCWCKICHRCNMDLKFWHGFDKAATWICQSCYIHLSPLPNMTKMKFD